MLSVSNESIMEIVTQEMQGKEYNSVQEIIGMIINVIKRVITLMPTEIENIKKKCTIENPTGFSTEEDRRCLTDTITIAAKLIEEIKKYNSRTSLVNHIILYIWEIKNKFSPDRVSQSNLERIYKEVGIRINDRKKYRTIMQIKSQTKNIMKKRKF